MTGNVLLPYTQHNITLPYLSYVHLYAYLDGPTGRPYDQSASTHESTHAHKQAHERNLSVALFGIECSLAAKIHGCQLVGHTKTSMEHGFLIMQRFGSTQKQVLQHVHGSQLAGCNFAQILFLVVLIILLMSDIELPSSVNSTDGCDSDVQLPTDIGSDAELELPPDCPECEEEDCGNSFGCKCRLKCGSMISENRVLELRQAHLGLPSEQERRNHAFAVVLKMTSDNGNVIQGYIKFSIDGNRVCRAFWEHAHAISKVTFDRMRKIIQNGATALPTARMPRARGSKEKRQYLKADTWFLNLYTGLGEPLAVSDASLLHPDDFVSVDEVHPLWAMSMLLDSEKVVPKRYLNPGTLEDLWLLYEVDTDAADRVSRATFTLVWRERWQKFLIFRNDGQGKRCKQCASIDQRKTLAVGSGERAELVMEKRHM